MAMKFALTGVHGSGKTTLLKKIESELTDRDISFVTINEVARSCPYPIGLHTSIKSQTWIFTEQLRQELIGMNAGADVVLCDRTLMDNVVYLERFVLLHNVPYSAFYMWKVAESWMDSYDIILRLPLNIRWLLNRDRGKGTEEEVTEFAEDINKLFDDCVHGDMITRNYHKSPPSAGNVADMIEAEIHDATTS